MPFHSYQHMKAKYDWFPEWHRNYHREYQRKLRAAKDLRPLQYWRYWYKKKAVTEVANSCKQNLFQELLITRIKLNYAKKR